MRYVHLSILFLIAIILATGCDAKKEQPVPKKTENPVMATPDRLAGGHPSAETPPASPHGAVPKSSKTVVVPDSVKGKWGKVKLIVEDKQSGKSSEYIVNLGSHLVIDGSGIKVAVREFLPDFTMDANTITSKSNEPNNPALRIEVFENDKIIFTGWLYRNYPQIHPFEHPRFGIILKEAIRS